MIYTGSFYVHCHRCRKEALARTPGLFIDDRIHFGISYKMAVRNFIRVFRKKYLSRKAFGARFTTKFDFHLILKY